MEGRDLRPWPSSSFPGYRSSVSVLGRTVVGGGARRLPGGATEPGALAVAPGSPEDVIRLLREVGRAMHVVYTQRLELGTVAEIVPQLRLFATVLREPGITISELARVTAMPKSQVSVLMARAASQGLVTRETDETDMRLVRLNLTPAGRTQLTRWRAAHHRLMLRVLRSLPADQLASVSGSLGVLLAAFQRDAVPHRDRTAEATPTGAGRPRGAS